LVAPGGTAVRLATPRPVQASPARPGCRKPDGIRRLDSPPAIPMHPIAPGALASFAATGRRIFDWKSPRECPKLQ
jgi:hypothetical protein